MSSCIDRIRPVICFLYVPVFGSIRLSSLAHSVFYGPMLGGAELYLAFIRLFSLIMLIILVSKNWGSTSNYTRGLALLWIGRIGSLLAFQQQMVDDNRELQIMSSLISYVCVSGLIFPSFSEYLLFALMLSSLRPLYLILVLNPAQSIFSVLYQRLLALTLGISITWTIHSQNRRNWLRSRKTQKDGRPGTHSGASTALEAPSAAEPEKSGADGPGCAGSGLIPAAETRQRARQVNAGGDAPLKPWCAQST